MPVCPPSASADEALRGGETVCPDDCVVLDRAIEERDPHRTRAALRGRPHRTHEVAEDLYRERIEQEEDVGLPKEFRRYLAGVVLTEIDLALDSKRFEIALGNRDEPPRPIEAPEFFVSELRCEVQDLSLPASDIQ